MSRRMQSMDDPAEANKNTRIATLLSHFQGGRRNVPHPWMIHSQPRF